MGGALAVFLMSMVGIMGMVGAAGPNTVATLGAPVAHVSWVVHNNEDSAVSGHYWALDNYTKTVTIWSTSVAGTYEINSTYSGTFCTFAGVGSPQYGPGVTEPTDECGLMTGGYDAQITSAGALNTTASPLTAIFNFGGSKTDIVITGGSGNPTPFDWIKYYFPSADENNFHYLNGDLAWSWTYTAPNGGQWINSGLGNTGDIVSSASSSLIAGANLQASTCALSLSSQVLNFGTILSGHSATASPVTVTNLGTVTSSLSILGDYWRNSASLAIGSPSWTTWSATPGLTGPTALTTSQVNTNANLAPLGGQSALTFALTVPVGTATAGAITQQISLVSGC